MPSRCLPTRHLVAAELPHSWNWLFLLLNPAFQLWQLVSRLKDIPAALNSVVFDQLRGIDPSPPSFLGPHSSSSDEWCPLFSWACALSVNLVFFWIVLILSHCLWRKLLQDMSCTAGEWTIQEQLLDSSASTEGVLPSFSGLDFISHIISLLCSNNHLNRNKNCRSWPPSAIHWLVCLYFARKMRFQCHCPIKFLDVVFIIFSFHFVVWELAATPFFLCQSRFGNCVLTCDS